MRKKALRVVAALLSSLLFVGVQTALASSVPKHREPALIINGVKQEIEATLDSTNTTMVPYREFFEALKMEATFDNKTKTVTAKNGDTTVTLTANFNTATVNGKDVQLYAGPFIDNGILFVNLRFISEAFGGVVKFIKNGTDSEHLTVTVDFPKANSN